jgi:hypothetical protein
MRKPTCAAAAENQPNSRPIVVGGMQYTARKQAC